MINEYSKNDISNILNIINDAAFKYKGIIMDKLKAIALEAKHIWTEHKKVVIAVGIILVIAIIV